MTTMRGRLATAEHVKSFMLAGNATLTMRSRNTGTRFTYRIRESDDGRVFFVGLLSGPDNDAHYTYMGILRRGDSHFRRTAKSRVGEDAPSHRAFAWTWRHVMAGLLPAEIEVWHEGRCGCCGRTLTVPESVERGIGPVCAAKMGLAA